MMTGRIVADRPPAAGASRAMRRVADPKKQVEVCAPAAAGWIAAGAARALRADAQPQGVRRRGAERIRHRVEYECLEPERTAEQRDVRGHRDRPDAVHAQLAG